MDTSPRKAEVGNTSHETSVLSDNPFAKLADLVEQVNNGEISFTPLAECKTPERHEWSKPRTKRGRAGSSGQSADMNMDEYQTLSVHDKLSVLFSEMAMSRDKMATIDTKLDQCLLSNGNIKKIENCMELHDHRLKLLEYKSIDLESKARRSNLIFLGFKETRTENCMQTIENMLRDTLDIEWPVHIERAYRLGAFNRGRTRAILVTFQNSADVQLVISKAHLLKDTPFSVNRDYPPEIANARKSLWKTYKSVKERYPESKVTMAYPAKIVKDNEVLYDKFPDWNDIMNKSRFKLYESGRSCKQTHSSQ